MGSLMREQLNALQSVDEQCKVLTEKSTNSHTISDPSSVVMSTGQLPSVQGGAPGDWSGLSAASIDFLFTLGDPHHITLIIKVRWREI